MKHSKIRICVLIFAVYILTNRLAYADSYYDEHYIQGQMDDYRQRVNDQEEQRLTREQNDLIRQQNRLQQEQNEQERRYQRQIIFNQLLDD